MVLLQVALKMQARRDPNVVREWVWRQEARIVQKPLAAMRHLHRSCQLFMVICAPLNNALLRTMVNIIIVYRHFG